MSLEIIAMYVVSFCLIAGALFMLIASIGLLRLKDAMTRLHGPTKAGTLGVGALLLASMLHSYFFGEGFSMHEVLIMAFLFVTAPISANFLAKVALHHRACIAPPPPTTDITWATFNVPQEDQGTPQAKPE